MNWGHTHWYSRQNSFFRSCYLWYLEDKYRDAKLGWVLLVEVIVLILLKVNLVLIRYSDVFTWVAHPDTLAILLIISLIFNLVSTLSLYSSCVPCSAIAERHWWHQASQMTQLPGFQLSECSSAQDCTHVLTFSRQAPLPLCPIPILRLVNILSQLFICLLFSLIYFNKFHNSVVEHHIWFLPCQGLRICSTQKLVWISDPICQYR